MRGVTTTVRHKRSSLRRGFGQTGERDAVGAGGYFGRFRQHSSDSYGTSIGVNSNAPQVTDYTYITKYVIVVYR